MEDTYLVQRLKTNPYPGFQNSFSFGGGYVNGGLSKEAIRHLSQIFEFDYMGSAEFEFGAVPEALQRMVNDTPALEAFSFTIPLYTVPEPYVPTFHAHRERDANGKLKPKRRVTVKEKRAIIETLGDATIYVLARSDYHDEIVKRVTELATDKFKGRLKQSPMVSRALRPSTDWDKAYKGWFELDNGFFFFIDKEMWQKTCDLFDLKTEPAGA